MNVNYDLLGSIPSMDVFRGSLDRLIADYEAGAPNIAERQAEFERIKAEGGIDALSAHVDKLLSDPKVINRIALGSTIELCAQHFYGIDTVEVGSIREVIELIKAMDNELEFGK